MATREELQKVFEFARIGVTRYYQLQSEITEEEQKHLDLINNIEQEVLSLLSINEKKIQDDMGQLKLQIPIREWKNLPLE